ncbi:MAG: hypothetical protein OEV40_06295 [Acidimicrobiia bacterium]|nr:hypothetical protein [Acidimicrobiia bacterium]
MSDDRLRWRVALDSFRAGLAAGERTLRTGAPPEPGRWPPAVLPAGPPPPELAAEALALLAEADALAAELADAMSRASAPSRPSRPSRRSRHRPSGAHARWAVTL